jgi:hypothetical protein
VHTFLLFIRSFQYRIKWLYGLTGLDGGDDVGRFGLRGYEGD